MTIIWYMVPEISTATDRFFLYSLTARKIKISNKWKTHVQISSFYTSALKIMIIIYTVPEIWHVTGVIVLFHFGLFFVLYPHNSQKNKNFKKTKKDPRDIIISHRCTKTHDHMLCCSWDLLREGCNSYFSLWAIFCPFTPLTAQKTKISKKLKKDLEISSFCTTVPKIMVICYTVPEILHVTHVIFIFYL